MSLYKLSLKRVLGLITILLFAQISAAADISFSLPDTALHESVLTKSISVYFSNFTDTIAGVRFQVETDPPGLIYFPFSETEAPFDTVGTLMSGWELIDADSVNNDETGIMISGLADWIAPLEITPPLPPQLGGKLINLKFRMNRIPDTLNSINVNLIFNKDIFSMANPSGQSLGIIIETTIVCLHYEGEVCVLADTTLNARFDSSQVDVKNGSIIIMKGICGDMNLDEKLDLLDISCLIRWLYIEKDNPRCPAAPCDINKDSRINLLDISFLINYLYRGGPPPPSGS
jgi:hypothetical protein